jgi:hypothetical protein
MFLLGVLAFFVLVRPVAAITMLARPSNNSAASLSGLPHHVVFGRYGILLLLLLLLYDAATSILASDASQICSLSCRCVPTMLLSRNHHRAAAIVLLPSCCFRVFCRW